MARARRSCVALLALCACGLGPARAAALPAYGITPTGQLLVFDTDTPQITQTVALTGLQPGETFVAIDIRPADGRLYGLTAQGRFYVISPASGVAEWFGGSLIGLALDGVEFAMDFDPVTDRARIISNTGQNFRIDPTSGQAVDGDPIPPGTQPDTPLGPGLPDVRAAAYVNNFRGAGNTRLFVIEAATDRVRYTDAPNSGVLTDSGPLDINVTADISLDVVGPSNLVFMAIPDGAGSRLTSVNLLTGQTTAGAIVGQGLASQRLKAFAVQWIGDFLRGVTTDNQLVRFSSMTPGTIVSTTPITGLQPGESILGIDYRPAQPQLDTLYGLGSTGRLYTISPGGQATQVGLGTFIVPLDGTQFAFSFDPVTDRIWTGSNTGQKLRVDPDTGVVDLNDPNAPAVPGYDWSTRDNVGYTFMIVLGHDTLVYVNTQGATLAIGEIGAAPLLAALAVEPASTFSFDAAFHETLVAENSPAAVLLVRRTHPDLPAHVQYTVLPGNSTRDVDYTLVERTLTFAPGQTQAGILFNVIDDAIDEHAEAFFVALKAVDPGTTLAFPDKVRVGIVDDDGPPGPAPTITILTPTTDSQFAAADKFVTITGTASGVPNISRVMWQSDTGLAGEADGNTSWTIKDVPLVDGTQMILVTVIDTEGAFASDAIAITRALDRYALAEGATGSFFDLDLAIANPNAVEAPVEITFLTSAGATVQQARVLPPASRTTIAVDAIPGLENAEASTVVRQTSTPPLPLAVERTMRWDASGYGAHTEKAIHGAGSLRWYFAEGSQGFFDTYFLLANPRDQANEALVEMFTEDGVLASTKPYPLAARSRLTIWAGGIPALVNQSFWTRVTFTSPGIAERAMYFGSPLFNAGHESAGVPAASPTWFHAEGATGSFFTTFLLLANPNDQQAQVTLTYQPAGGVPVVKQKLLPPRARTTINVALEDASLANAAVATRVESSLPIVSERSMYWPVTPESWNEAHNSVGDTATDTKWALAEGRVGGSHEDQTYILLANPHPIAVAVTITYLRENAPLVQKQYVLQPSSRFNVDVGAMVPELANERFGALIQSTAPIFVERAMYANVNGVLWASGTNATATRVP